MDQGENVSSVVAYFNSTKLIVIRRATIAGDACTLVEWPNGDRSWLDDHEVRSEPRT